MYKIIKISAIAIALVAFSSCKNEQKSDKNQDVAELEVMAQETTEVTGGEVMTKEMQDELTPDGVLQSLKEGNTRFVNNELTPRNKSKQVINTAGGQYPEAVILSCLDSRVPVEKVFDRGIGDLFVARVACNFSNVDILGSMEFACKVSGAKVVVVLGHQSCGGIRAAVDDVKLGNITAMLQKIKPAVALVDYDGEKTSVNSDFVAMVCERNVHNTINDIRKNSPILKEMEDNDEIKIVGAVYNVENGNVEWLS
ncbi:carbonic anhydrase [Aequorivita sublithincola DSM 14238]|uniref:Carbonic anhydrase n=1 Tax=Aequorivita sublithincola (strain DSM 14238 / LMG 21431 / ACAM 643 / 9-3) TaxID=746697 RepID=I3YYY6_AEQSU|nr:carbonic anhydrase family protein [Aequorivita sublithincola]AFL82204.1 carbonic anhydrase [Aequorivita sublithincola DSM 14238]